MKTRSLNLYPPKRRLLDLCVFEVEVFLWHWRCCSWRHNYVTFWSPLDKECLNISSQFGTVLLSSGFQEYIFFHCHFDTWPSFFASYIHVHHHTPGFSDAANISTVFWTLERELQKSLSGTWSVTLVTIDAKPAWCHPCPALYRLQKSSLDSTTFSIPSRWIPTDVLIMSFCSRWLSLIISILYKDLSSVEEAYDPKRISRHLQRRWRKGCERVGQHRLFLYICLSVCVCEYLLNESVCVCVRVCAPGVCVFYLCTPNIHWVFLTRPHPIVQYEECQWADCCWSGPRPGIPGVLWDSLQCPELPTKHGTVS